MRVVPLALLAACVAVPCLAAPRQLTFEERVQAQRAIDEVYWRHRIWPADNPGPKPSLDQVLSDAAIREKVEDYLRKGDALTTTFAAPVGSRELQSELSRMASGTKDGAMLGELFAALGNDPNLIADCLVRPILVDRLAREKAGADFDVWWGKERAAHVVVLPTLDEPIAPVAPNAVSCTDDTWSTIKSDIPDAMNAHTAVWTGTEMLVWGGEDVPWDGGPYYSAGFRYNPATNTWTRMSALGAPAPRYRHTTVWTGTEMIVWGGTVLDPTNTGGRYNPATDTWTPTAVSASVTAVADHTAVWTGSKMIVWGGLANAGPIIGGLYDPVADTWTTVSTGSAPPDRFLHTAVWTGSRMIVWGGVSSASNSGGIYDPATNTWVGATNLGGDTPTGRSRHSAVWTGSKMIVWGGGLNTGGVYDPPTNTWTATSLVNAPSARTNNTAVWTGSQMIVWGGNSNGANGFNSGGRYDPVTNTWAATGVGPNVPSARDRHSAVWTGSEMIVWGGRLSSPSVKETYRNGGRYNPVTDSWTATATERFTGCRSPSTSTTPS